MVVDHGCGRCPASRYNVLTFDGPGQSSALFRQKLHFRYDWEQVLTPVVEALLTRKDVDADRIGILGSSQGGYWVPRALAFEKRIGAAVLDPGVFDVSTSWTSEVPRDALEGLLHTTGAEQEKIKAEFDQGVQEEMANNAYATYTITSRMFPFGTTSFSETLILLSDYNLNGVIDKITTPLIIASPEGESFWPGQSQEVYDKAPATLDKTLAPFTVAEGADLHCEVKANGLRAQVFFDWLDTALGITQG